LTTRNIMTSVGTTSPPPGKGAGALFFKTKSFLESSYSLFRMNVVGRP
jgi:hypothetical protein